MFTRCHYADAGANQQRERGNASPTPRAQPTISIQPNEDSSLHERIERLAFCNAEQIGQLPVHCIEDWLVAETLHGRAPEIIQREQRKC